MDKLKILNVGPGYGDSGNAASSPEKIFESLGELDIETMDANESNHPTWIHDISEPIADGSEFIERYDIVHCSHVVEHIDRAKVMTALINLAKMVRVGGELWIIVPALEWAADEIVHGRESVHVQAVLYGAQQNEYDYHRVGFTLITMRQLLEAIGLVIRRAHQEMYMITFKDSDSKYLPDMNVPQNLIVALKIAPVVEEKAEDAISLPEEKNE